MNSRERVIGALERKKIDRVPTYLACRGPISAIDKLLSHFDVDNEEEVRRKLNIDIRGVAPRYTGPEGMAPISAVDGVDTVFGGSEYVKCDYDGSGGIAGTYADEFGHRPFKDVTTVKEIEEYSWPTTEMFDFSSIEEDCIQYRDYGIMCGGWAPILSRVFELFGMEKALMLFYDKPELIHAAIEKMTDFYYEYYDKSLQAAKGGIQILGLGDDFATQRDLMVSPKMWKEFSIKPLARLFSLGKKHNAYVFFHSCGAVRSVLHELVNIGMDILFPVQPNAWGMDHRELKAEYGDKLAFWGGIDVQEVLPFGTTEDVRQCVRERIEILGTGGGYILSSSHNLLRGFPLENILAMYDEAMKTSPR
jgi:uroporphyrinogen decarboxylase